MLLTVRKWFSIEICNKKNKKIYSNFTVLIFYLHFLLLVGIKQPQSEHRLLEHHDLGLVATGDLWPGAPQVPDCVNLYGQCPVAWVLPRVLYMFHGGCTMHRGSPPGKYNYTNSDVILCLYVRNLFTLYVGNNCY